ncbi:MAG TPA: DVUA0089 family protein [Leptolyngbyaceae cyanobacterium M33_DOE_097]|uniref:Filamentous hemagglutinin N-terminal domain-containing protein n=1 Tax=Oscillatoriales cyanobacterium SpSt-418 TaxID=2282169 RepID=A0A7C3KAQ5_9CYAN|nr:DVUA0089 family protein [Leptolyngbyaceae cyanobacterium M33_DOE_097]
MKFSHSRWFASEGALIVTVLSFTSPVSGQIVPDQTLPTNSQVNAPGCTNCVIEGGTLRGNNLFHSFQQFSIPTGGSAFFNNPAAIENILTRVTGSSISNIDGLLKANGTANFFLLNPNGVVFGPNARLELGGSFFASTANSFKFSDGSEFSATNPQAPPLLSVNITPGLQYGKPVGDVQNQGNLQVKAGSNLTLFGSTVLNQGGLVAPGGRVEVLGDRVALLDTARVDVSSPFGGGTVLIGGDYQGKGVVPNAQQTFVSPGVAIAADATQQGKGGTIIVWADQTTRFYGSASAKGSGIGGDGGLVEVSGKQNLAFQGQVDTSAVFGKTGTLLLDPTNITITNAAPAAPPPAAGDSFWLAGEDVGDQVISPAAISTLLTSNFLYLEAENAITIASDVALNSPNNFILRAGNSITNTNNATITQTGSGGIFLQTAGSLLSGGSFNPAGVITFTGGGITSNSAGGQGGLISISTGTLTLQGGARLSVDSGGTGNPGSIEVFAANAVNLIGPGSGIFANVQNANTTPIAITEIGEAGQTLGDAQNAAGQTITTISGNVSNTNDVDVFQITLSGNQTFSATTVGGTAFDTQLFLFDSSGRGIYADDQSGGANQATLPSNNPLTPTTAGTYYLAISAWDNDPQSVAGRIFGAGDFLVGATGEGASAPLNSWNNSGLGSNGNYTITLTGTGATATAQAGNILVQTPYLQVANGARISSSTLGSATGGNVSIQADRVDLIGAQSGILAETQAAGTAGNLTFNPFNTPNLAVNFASGARISAETSNTGQGGNIAIATPQGGSVTLSGQGNLSVDTTGEGNGGLLSISTAQLRVQAGTQITANTRGAGDAGMIDITAQNVILTGANTRISADTTDTFLNGNLAENGDAGQLLGNAQSFTGQVVTSISGVTDGTNDVDLYQITLDGSQPFSASTVGIVDTQLFLFNSTGQGIYADDQSGANNQAALPANNLAPGNYYLAVSAWNNDPQSAGGNIFAPGDLVVEPTGPGGASPLTGWNNSGLGSSGSYTINLTGVGDPQGNTVIPGGNGGTINLRTDTLAIADGAKISSNTTGSGLGGSVNIEANTVNLTGSDSQILAQTSSTGDAGFLTLQAQRGSTNLNVTLGSGTEISASTSGAGAGGGLLITAPNEVTLQGPGSISADTSSSGIGGFLSIDTSILNIANGTKISAATSGAGLGGDLEIIAPEAVSISGQAILSVETTNAGEGGDLLIATGNFLLQQGSRISADTRGSGDAGFLTIDATGSAVVKGNSQISGSVGKGAAGNGNLIQLTAQNLELSDGGQVRAETEGSGNAGTIDVIVDNAISIIGTNSGFFATTQDYTIDPSGVPVAEIGDAGQLADGTAQNTTNLGAGQFVTQITGNLSDGNDVDVYQIALTGNQAFSAITSSSTGLDSQLFLFNANGTGVYGDDQSGGGGNQAALPAGNPLTPTAAGTYYLAISGWNVDPSSAGGAIFEPGDYLVGPNGPGGGTQPLSRWEGPVNTSGGSYTIDLTGILGAPAPQRGGEGGGIQIQAKSVTVNQGSISATTSGQGNAGDVTLNVNALTLTGSNDSGARVLTSSTGSGNAGDITVKATQAVTLDNLSGLRAQATGTGNAGDISITTPLLTLDNSDITVSSVGVRAAGKLDIQAGQVELNNQSKLTATTVGGIGQGINLTGLNSLNVNNSLISASTVNGQAGGVVVEATGGSVTLSGLLSDGSPGGIAIAATGSGDAGELTITTSQLTFEDGAGVSANNQSSLVSSQINLNSLDTFIIRNTRLTASTQDGEAGNFQVNAKNSVFISGTAPNGQPAGIFVEATGAGEAGSLAINTSQLTVQQGGQVSVSNTGTGIGGDLTIDANAITLNNGKLTAQTISGTGGDITLGSAQKPLQTLQLSNGSQVSASTATGTQGGSVSVFAANFVSLSGNSAIAAAATAGGNAGDLFIQAPQLNLNNSRASVSSTGNGQAGEIDVKAQSINLENGSRLAATTENGLGGNITFDGLVNLQLDNGTITASTESGKAGNVTIAAANEVRLENGSAISVAATEGGTAGTLGIITQRFRVEDSQVSVSSRTGIAGDLNVEAGTVYLYQGQLTALNGQGSGGNINLDVDGLAIQLRAESLISAEAFGTANGSNISVLVPNGYLIAFPFENSDITADAQAGSGGTVRVDALALFGIEFRPARTPLSDITANSQTGADGSVEVNTLGIDPTRGLVPLATDLSDPTNQVSQACSAQRQTDNRFVVTGRGGLPASPEDGLTGLQPQVELLAPLQGGTNQTASPQSNQKPQAETQIVEAQGWVRNADGSIALIAQSANTSQGQWQPNAECQIPIGDQGLDQQNHAGR